MESSITRMIIEEPVTKLKIKVNADPWKAEKSKIEETLTKLKIYVKADPWKAEKATKERRSPSEEGEKTTRVEMMYVRDASADGGSYGGSIVKKSSDYLLVGHERSCDSVATASNHSFASSLKKMESGSVDMINSRDDSIIENIQGTRKKSLRNFGSLINSFSREDTDKVLDVSIILEEMEEALEYIRGDIRSLKQAEEVKNTKEGHWFVDMLSCIAAKVPGSQMYNANVQLSFIDNRLEYLRDTINGSSQ